MVLLGELWLLDLEGQRALGLCGPFWDRHDSPCAERDTRLMRDGMKELHKEKQKQKRTRRTEALPWAGQPAGNTDIVGLVPGQHTVCNNRIVESQACRFQLSLPLADSIPNEGNRRRRVLLGGMNL